MQFQEPLTSFLQVACNRHTNELRKVKCIELVDQEHIRGSVKTRYRATTKMLLDTPELDVDEQAWLDVNEVLHTAYERIEDIKVEAANRKAAGAKTFRMPASLLGYPSPAEKAD